MIKQEVKLAEEISNYLGNHPGAGDTLEGITTWWLKPGDNQPPVKKVSAALEILVKKGLVRKRTIPGGNTIYKAASACYENDPRNTRKTRRKDGCKNGL